MGGFFPDWSAPKGLTAPVALNIIRHSKEEIALPNVLVAVESGGRGIGKEKEKEHKVKFRRWNPFLESCAVAVDDGPTGRVRDVLPGIPRT